MAPGFFVWGGTPTLTNSFPLPLAGGPAPDRALASVDLFHRQTVGEQVPSSRAKPVVPLEMVTLRSCDSVGASHCSTGAVHIANRASPSSQPFQLT